MFWQTDLHQLVTTPAQPARAAASGGRTPAGAENNRTRARERYRRMSPEDRASYNQRITDRRKAAAASRGTE